MLGALECSFCSFLLAVSCLRDFFELGIVWYQRYRYTYFSGFSLVWGGRGIWEGGGGRGRSDVGRDRWICRLGEGEGAGR